MQRRVIALAGVIVATTAVGAWASGSGAPTAQPQLDGGSGRHLEQVGLRDTEGQRVGTVRMHQEGGEVRVRATLRGLSPGFHGFHVHETGVCDPDAPDGPFTTAGDHYRGDGGSHGAHDGDMPSLFVAADGTARLSYHTDRFTLDDLRSGNGSAVMVHEGRDNFANIPDRYTSSLSGKTGPDKDTRSTGDAGDRAACGVLGGDDGSGQDGDGLVTVTSEDGFLDTVRRIRGDIESSDDLTLVSVVNHAAAARESGQGLRPTTLLVFGNPAAGTPLMQESRTFGIDLPQKLLVWRDDGVVNVTYNDPHRLADRHGVTGQEELLDDIEATLRQLATGD